MKFSALVLVLALAAVACNKKEEANAIQVVPVQGEVPAMNAEEGHDKEHHHVTEAVDHTHEDAHHADHDHKAHHPNHDTEVGSDPQTQQ
jgi:hypothetical protein